MSLVTEILDFIFQSIFSFATVPMDIIDSVMTNFGNLTKIDCMSHILASPYSRTLRLEIQNMDLGVAPNPQQIGILESNSEKSASKYIIELLNQSKNNCKKKLKITPTSTKVAILEAIFGPPSDPKIDPRIDPKIDHQVCHNSSGTTQTT